MNTFAISSAQIDRLTKKANDHQSIITEIDNHGKHGNQPTVLDETKSDMKKFLSQFPKYSSHYGWVKGYGSSVLMLAPCLTKKHVYDEFKEKKHVSQKWFEGYWRKNNHVSIHKAC